LEVNFAVLGRPALGSADRGGEEVLVEREADQPDVARLPVPEELAPAPQVEVLRADRHAGAQPVERLEGPEPLDRRGRELGPGSVTR
jgi:hypothetical protein